jgi:hypothetical protein
MAKEYNIPKSELAKGKLQRLLANYDDVKIAIQYTDHNPDERTVYFKLTEHRIEQYCNDSSVARIIVHCDQVYELLDLTNNPYI